MTEKSSELHQVSMIIGGLQQAVQELTSNWREQDRRASEGRQRLYENFDELKDDVRNRLSAVENTVSTLGADVASMKPAVDDWRATRERATGATFATKFFGRAIYFIASVGLVAGGFFLAHVTVLAK